MALPIAPLAGVALRYCAVALAAYALTQRAHAAPRDQKAEDALDRMPEGFGVRGAADSVSATGRMARTFALGSSGPAIELDARAFGRVRWRRVPR